jgi:heme exporter protein CcmD
MNAMNYVIASYVVFAVGLLVDLLVPVIARRELMRKLRGRLTRQRQKESQS